MKKKNEEGNKLQLLRETLRSNLSDAKGGLPAPDDKPKPCGCVTSINPTPSSPAY